MKRFLFFPLEVGIAHISRSLAIAEKLVFLGHESIVAMPSHKIKYFKNTTAKLINIGPSTDSESASFLDKFIDPNYLLKLTCEEHSLIRELKPDCVVVDYRLSAIASSISNGIKTVFVCDGGWGPYNFVIPNPGIHPLVFNFLSLGASFVIKRLKNKITNSIFRAAVSDGIFSESSKYQLERNILYIVPEHSKYLPALDNSYQLKYTGPIFWHGFENANINLPEKNQLTGKTIYLTFGGTGFDSEKLIKLCNLFVDAGYNVLVTGGTVASVKDFPALRNLYVYDFLNGKEAAQLADIIVCHGGYGTMIQAILAGKPVVALPYNFSQMLHTLRFQELGLGKCALKINTKVLSSLVKLNWASFEASAKNILPESVLQDVDLVMRNYDDYEKNIKSFTKDFSIEDGDVVAAKSILEFVA